MARSDAPFVTSHTDLGDHEKTKDFCQSLGIRRTEGVGLIHLLWHYAAQNAPSDGRLLCPATTLADEVYWAGDPDALVDAFVQAGFIDVDGSKQYVHEWELHGGDHHVLSRKREYDRRRLQSLRKAEQQALPIDVDVGSTQVKISDERLLPEPVRVHIVLGADDKIMANDLRRIQRTLELFPRQSGYDVALNYIGWQEEEARVYRETRKGRQPHIDRIKGWQNQMRMHARKGWTLREELEPAGSKSRVLEFSDEDAERYSS